MWVSSSVSIFFFFQLQNQLLEVFSGARLGQAKHHEGAAVLLTAWAFMQPWLIRSTLS